ncbi:MAG: hypothetical protein JNK05_36680 [Myxococcales bacterium]|nr:hypothetical protein [Myxococcales bacterium]
MSDSQRTIAVLRAIALLGALPFAAGCADAHAQVAPTPNTGRVVRVRSCPSSLPAQDSRCVASAAEGAMASCRYAAARCVCVQRGTRGARWSCAHVGVMRGPLPPPELSEALS